MDQRPAKMLWHFSTSDAISSVQIKESNPFNSGVNHDLWKGKGNDWDLRNLNLENERDIKLTLFIITNHYKSIINELIQLQKNKEKDYTLINLLLRTNLHIN